MKKRSVRKCIGARARAGESMVAVAVMLLVFFTIGGSILTAAAGATAASSARISQRQAYYYTRSILVPLDKSLREGELKNILCQDALDQIVAAYAGGGTDVELNNGQEKTIDLQVAFDGAGAENGKIHPELAVRACALSYKGKGSVLNTATDPATLQKKVTEVSVRLNSVDLTVQTTYKTSYSSSMDVNYRFSGYGKLNQTTNQWEWSGTWVVQQVG